MNDQNDKAPLIRGSQIKTNVKSLDLLGEEAQEEVFKRITRRTLKLIEEASKVSWLPLELDIELKDGQKFKLMPGMSFQAADDEKNPHLVFTEEGAKVFIVD